MREVESVTPKHSCGLAFEVAEGVDRATDLCSPCRSPIKSETENLSGKVIVKLGLFPRIPQPEFESFMLHKNSWEPNFQDVIKFKLSKGGERFEE